jgi:hypothetical protein
MIDIRGVLEHENEFKFVDLTRWLAIAESLFEGDHLLYVCAY